MGVGVVIGGRGKRAYSVFALLCRWGTLVGGLLLLFFFFLRGRS
jgi:hypothetical protein